MTSTQPTTGSHTSIALFSLTLFISASLMFILQPMFGKLLLPLLGGSPAVWNTCMVFYQAILFFGYLYAHLISRYTPNKRQIIIQTGVILLSLIALPVGLSEQVSPPTDHNPTLWLIGTLCLAIGLPFFTISTLSPLLQKWFSNIDHPHSDDPYFLYAASNAGSLLALLSYPFLIEPNIGVASQTFIWSIGYALLGALVLGCAALLWRTAPESEEQVDSETLDTDDAALAPLDWPIKLRWLALAFAPSSLLLGVTNYISTDVAAVPLLWIIPLALYLLSFVILFSKFGTKTHPWMLTVQPAILLPFIAFSFINPAIIPYWLNLALHLMAFFFAIMVCHGELAASRPHTRDLTTFYLIMSFGGMLGGMFNTFVAPFIFNAVYEYPIMIVAALLLRPGLHTLSNFAHVDAENPLWQRALKSTALPIVVLITALVLYAQTDHLGPYIDLIGTILLLLTGLLYATRHNTLSLALFAGVLLLLTTSLHQLMSNTVEQERTFFGVLSVRKSMAPSPDGKGMLRFNEVWHGTTKHGAQNIAKAASREPLNYYSRPGPIGQLFKTFDNTNDNWKIGVVGLGAGALACYAKPQQAWDFFELDPAVIAIANNPEYFTYLKTCAPQAKMVVGDARLSLTKAPEAHYDLLVLDAFSSDAIPTHLLTLEALELYLTKLKPGGMLAFHITNRHLNLHNVLATLAKTVQVDGLQQAFKPKTEIPQIVATDWVVLTRQTSRLTTLKQSHRGHWRPLPLTYDDQPWSDDFTDIVRAWKSTD